MFTVGFIPWLSEQQHLMKQLVKPFVSLSMQSSIKEVLFTRGTTTSLNWVARFAEEVLTEGDQVLISVMEHHSKSFLGRRPAVRLG